MRNMNAESTAKQSSNSNLVGALSRKEAAKYLSLSTRKLDSLASEGKIAKRKCGRKTLFLIADLNRFLLSLEVANG